MATQLCNNYDLVLTTQLPTFPDQNPGQEVIPPDHAHFRSHTSYI